MIANWLAEVQAATARGNNLSGTSIGISECDVGSSKARAQPIMNTAANSRSRLSTPAINAAVSISAAQA